ncbi:hypothetical protein Dimus_024507, partial [Dionaea muscipula]
VRKGKPMASRRSSRVASQGSFHRENVVEKESVTRTEKRKKNEKQKRKAEEKAPTSDHKEPRSKNKHDKDVGEEELLSEMLQKAKMTKKAAKECEELRQQAKRKGDSPGVDPSAEKKQKFEKRAEEKGKEKVTKETYFSSSDCDDDGLLVKALPIDLIWRKRVIRSKIVRERWMNDNGLSNVMELIKRQKWENLFKRRELVHIDAVKEFYAKMSVIHLKKRDVVKSKVRGVDMEFDHEKLATILGVSGKNGICEYIKDVWEESKYTKPLEITRRFTNDGNLTVARRVKSGELKPFQRFGKSDTSSFLDLTYMDHLMSRRLVNLPRVMIRHMSYVISMKDHELPYGDWLTLIFKAFGVPLVDKKGEEPKRYDFFEDTFLTMCKLTRENGIWWIGSGENRRRDVDVTAPDEEAEEEDEGNKDDWEAVVEEDAEVEGESGSGEKFYDAEDKDQSSPEVNEESPAAVPQSSAQQKEQGTSGVDPSCSTGRIPEVEITRLQADFERKRANRFLADLAKAKAENARLLALLHQAQSKPHP